MAITSGVVSPVAVPLLLAPQYNAGRRRQGCASSAGGRGPLQRTKTGLLRIDHGAAKREAHLDGKWLLRTSDVTLTPEDLAAAYKQLLAVERGWRDMKGALGLRPVFHYREDRIRGHIQLCWLALLLIRVAENTTGDTWRNLRHELGRMHLIFRPFNTHSRSPAMKSRG